MKLLDLMPVQFTINVEIILDPIKRKLKFFVVGQPGALTANRKGFIWVVVPDPLLSFEHIISVFNLFSIQLPFNL